MANDANLKQARNAFNALCAMLDENDWHYDLDEEKLTIECSARGDDLPMDVTINVDAERQLVLLISHMPYDIPEEKRTALAIAVTLANNAIVDGSFDYDVLDGNILFRLTSSFRNSIVSKEMFKYMLYVSCTTIDEYNDKFLFVAKKDMSLDEIIEFMK